MLRRFFSAAEEASPEEVQKALEAGEPCVVLDVRDQDEWEAGHVPGSMWIPLDQLQLRLDELPKDKMIYALCHSGGRSALAVKLLTAQGYQAKNVSGGILQWKETLES